MRMKNGEVVLRQERWNDEMKKQDDGKWRGRKLEANDVTPLFWIFIGQDVTLWAQCETETCYAPSILPGYFYLKDEEDLRFFTVEVYSL
jgi:hypothetical protein